MRVTILLVFLFAAFSVKSQLYESYIRKGVANSTGGPNPYELMIQLQKDGTFIFVGKAYGTLGKEKILVSHDSSHGKWNVNQGRLYLDFSPDTIFQGKLLDTYRIKRRGLKRITTDRVRYKAFGKKIAGGQGETKKRVQGTP